jgi:hypothetical protein
MYIQNSKKDMQQISFITNTGSNTLPYTKLLLKSLKENLVGKEHEIIVFIDHDNDGTYEYLKSIKSDFFDLKIVTHKLNPLLGHQRNSNLLVDIAKHDIISYLHSDMIVSKNYDIDILEDLEDNCILSSTRIEPSLHPKSDITFTKDLGLDPANFDWDRFIQIASELKTDKQIEYFFAPYTFYKHVWQRSGGYDTLFRRAREDSDFLQRLLHLGIKVKQTYKANVYHFTCVSSRGVNWYDETDTEAQQRRILQSEADIIELRRFVRKWGAFNHGTHKLTKYDVDLVIKNFDVDDNIPIGLDPLFSRVWVPTDDIKKRITKKLNSEHYPANRLLEFSDDDWEQSKKYYNITNYNEIYNIGDPSEYNIKIEIDTKHLNMNNPFIQYAYRIHEILKEYQPGRYELGSAVIYINRLVIQSANNIYINNPQFDYSLLKIE